MTPKLASFVGYLRLLNGETSLALPLLNYARRSGLSDEALLLNLAFALRESGKSKDLDEAAAILGEVRQRFGDREKANLLLVTVIQNQGSISIADANRLFEPCPPTGFRYRMQSKIYFTIGYLARRRDAELAREYLAKSAELMVQACHLGEDQRHWNSLRKLLPNDIRKAHSEYFKDSGSAPAPPDSRDFTMDPLAGLQLQQIMEVAADHEQKPIVVAGR
jgi:hypothetical protein